MAKVTLIPFDIADHLRSPREMALYLDAMFEDASDEPRSIVRALGDIARAQGMTDVARTSGLGRESLYKALSGDKSPSFDTVLRVIRALGLRLRVELHKPRPQSMAARRPRQAGTAARRVPKRTKIAR